jgi:hypothetical protein
MKAGARTLAGGGRRLVTLVAGISAVTTVVSLAFGVLLQASALRSISVGLYVVGAGLIAIGCVHGVRGPIRVSGSSGTFGIERSGIRWATREEQEESIAASALFVVLGLALLLIGLLADARHPLI